MTQPPNWTNSKMNPWVPDDNPHQARRIGKTGEEVNELGSVLFRISIQGIDSVDPSSGKTNRQRLLEESADVYAQLDCNMDAIFSAKERNEIYLRAIEKRRQMAEWEAHYPVATEDAANVRGRDTRTLQAVGAAVAAINFAVTGSEGLEFLRAWQHGDWGVIRKEWPEAPAEVFADEPVPQ